jgi:hypothetical protein
MVPSSSTSSHNVSPPAVVFDMAAQDVMVFLHIQKTGGTIFGKHLVQDLNLRRRCECSKGVRKHGRRKKMRCACLRPGPGEQRVVISLLYVN